MRVNKGWQYIAVSGALGRTGLNVRIEMGLESGVEMGVGVG